MLCIEQKFFLSVVNACIHLPFIIYFWCCFQAWWVLSEIWSTYFLSIEAETFVGTGWYDFSSAFSALLQDHEFVWKLQSCLIRSLMAFYCIWKFFGLGTCPVLVNYSPPICPALDWWSLPCNDRIPLRKTAATWGLPIIFFILLPAELYLYIDHHNLRFFYLETSLLPWKEKPGGFKNCFNCDALSNYITGIIVCSTLMTRISFVKTDASCRPNCETSCETWWQTRDYELT